MVKMTEQVPLTDDFLSGHFEKCLVMTDDRLLFQTLTILLIGILMSLI